jgi:hypothetical protein
MKKKEIVEVKEEELKENEEFISRDDIDIQVSIDEETNIVSVDFIGFDDIDDAEEYAEFLATTLPLLLFETTRLQ